MIKKDTYTNNIAKNKRGILKLTIVLSIILFYLLLQIMPYKGFSGLSNFKVEEGEAPFVIAHGGSKHLYPENTVMAFEESNAMGVDVLEMDLCLTKDGILITHHNLTVDATSDASGYVNDFTYEQIISMNFGYKFVNINGDKPFENETDPLVLSRLVPMTVEQMFETFSNQTLYIMEIKDSGDIGVAAANELNSLINKYNLQENVCVAAFDQEIIQYYNTIKDDAVNVSMDFNTATSFIVLNYLGFGMFADFDYAGLQLPSSYSVIPLNTPYLMYKTHHSNMFMHYWTINNKQEMKDLIELGCDGIITDRPDLMFEALQELGYNNNIKTTY